MINHSNSGDSNANTYIADLRDFNGYDTTGNNDSTANIQAAINQAVLGKAKVRIPFKNYSHKIAGPLITSVAVNGQNVNPNAQIVVPDMPLSDTMGVIEIEGEIGGNWATEAVAGVNRNRRGCILESTIAGSGFRPSIIGSVWRNYPSIANRNYVHAKFNNFFLRFKSSINGAPNSMCGINGSKFISMDIPYLKVDPSQTLVDIPAPTADSIGIIWPRVNNKALITAGYIFTEGLTHGQLIQEHFIGNYLLSAGCMNGLSFDRCYHAVVITKYLAENCPKSLYFPNAANVTIVNYETEHHTNTGPSWAYSTHDAFFEPSPINMLNDADNYGYAGTQSLHIIHANHVKPNHGGGINEFWTNDASKVRIDRMNGTFDYTVANI